MCMRGDERIQDVMFSYVSLEQRVPGDHPLREVRKVTDGVLGSLSGELDALYAEGGRPSIAPEYILRALLLQVSFLFVPSDCWWSRSITTCCFAGSWDWAWTMGFGTMRCFRRTGSGC